MIYFAPERNKSSTYTHYYTWHFDNQRIGGSGYRDLRSPYSTEVPKGSSVYTPHRSCSLSSRPNIDVSHLSLELREEGHEDLQHLIVVHAICEWGVLLRDGAHCSWLGSHRQCLSHICPGRLRVTALLLGGRRPEAWKSCSLGGAGAAVLHAQAAGGGRRRGEAPFNHPRDHRVPATQHGGRERCETLYVTSRAMRRIALKQP